MGFITQSPVGESLAKINLLYSQSSNCSMKIKESYEKDTEMQPGR